jgi:O-acetyl-ADP-ribose deacetylase (regulator of RNase III)
MSSPDIFLSYSWKDQEAAQQLRQTLEKAQLRVAWDGVAASLSHSLTHSLLAAIQKAECLVVLLTPNSVQSPWVVEEVRFARFQGVRVVPVLLGMTPSEVPREITTFDGAAVPESLREAPNLLMLQVGTGDVHGEWGRVAQKLYSVVRRVKESSFWRPPPSEFLRLFPEDHPSEARASIFFDPLQDVVSNHGFGKVGIVCPTSLDGGLGGIITSKIIQDLNIDVAQPTPVTPSRPVVIGTSGDGKATLIAATVFNDKRQPRSRDQRSAVKGILELATRLGLNMVFAPQLGTGPHYGYPQFQAYKAFLGGALEYYNRPGHHGPVPWLGFVVCDKAVGLYLKYNSSLTEERVTRLASGVISLRCQGPRIESAKPGSTLSSLVPIDRATIERPGVVARLPMGNKPDAYVERFRGEPFAYPLNTLLEDTIYYDDDEIVIGT